MDLDKTERDETQASILDVQARLLYSFSLPESAGCAGYLETLLKLEHNGRKVWKRAEPKGAYRQEMLASADTFLFEDDASGGYLTVSDVLCDLWFRRGSQILYGSRKRSLIATLIQARVELFILRDGIGVLSIRLHPYMDRSWQADTVKRFIYRVAQLRENTFPAVELPHPASDTGRQDKVRNDMPAPPLTGESLSSRLGSWGGSFGLGELVSFLLGPFGEKNLSPNRQLAAYTVVRLSEQADFKEESCLQAWGLLLSGLAQIEEPLHAGDVPGKLTVCNEVMNSKHWAAVSILGSAHLIADQEASVAFNEQRMSVVMDKYFLAFLLAHLQRLQIHQAVMNAQGLVTYFREEGVGGRGNKGRVKLLHLRQSLAEFSVFGNLSEISGREAVNRFYLLCRRGLRVREALMDIRDAVSDFGFNHDSRYAQEIAERLEHNIDTVAAVQSKLEWLEVFIGSFYAAELVHMLSDAGSFSRTYKAFSVPAWAIGSATVIAFSLRPWEHGNQKKRGSVRFVGWLVGISVLMLLIWFASGHLFFKDLDGRTSEPRHGHAGTAVEARPSPSQAEPRSTPPTRGARRFAA